MPIYKFLVSNRSNDPRNGGYLKDAHALGYQHLKSIQVQDLYFIEGQLSQEDSQQLALKLLSDPVTQTVSWTDLSLDGTSRPMPEDNSVIVERDSMLPRPTIRAGDVLIGFRSSGPHMNGYSLINKVFEGTPLADSLANVLLAPHHWYFHLLYPHLAQCKALAHITGGGFIENIPRVLPENLRALVYLSSWQRPYFGH
jgi:hypothetical protein